jgi:hypothetical protein
VPSLDLRFADNKSLVDAVTGASLVTFTRASSGTFVDSAGVIQTAATDVPRFDHNPTTLESLGLLVEEQRTNLCLQSEDISNAAWALNGGTVTTNTTAAPNGQTTADTFTVNASIIASVHQVITCLASTTYTWSFFVRLGTLPVNDFRIAVRDDTNGAFIAQDVVPNVTPVTTEWRRVVYTFTTPVGCVLVRPYLIRSLAGIGGTVFLWGADLQAASTPSSYIPTTTAAVTRSASVADVINQAIANNIRTLYLEFRSPASGTRGVASLNDNTANERASVLTSGTDPRLVVVDGGVEQANVNGGTVTANQRTRIAVRINANDFAISINGGAVVTDASGTLPTVDRLMLGRTQAGEYLNGTLARVTGWTQLLPDSTLQSLAQ